MISDSLQQGAHTGGLDTSGVVMCTTPGAMRWEDLVPFAQGYVEAMFASAGVGSGLLDRSGKLGLGFSDLAPETLARIMGDCGRHCGKFPQPHDYPDVARANGDWNWKGQQLGFWPRDWPPLTVRLSADGLIYLREASHG